MTGPDESSSPDGQAGPEPRGQVTLEELADLDAGLLTEDEEQLLRSRIAHDPDAADRLAMLEQVHGDLRELDDEPVPDDVMAQLDAALAVEAANADAGTDPANKPATPATDEPEAAPVVDLAAARASGRTGARRRGTDASRMRRLAVGALSVAAAAVVAVVVSGVIRDTAPPPPQPGSAPGDALILGSADLPAQWPDITQVHDLGFLVAPGELGRCLTTSSGRSDLQVLGARPVVVDDQYGVLIAVPADREDPEGDVRLLVLGPHCDGDRDVIAETVVPR